MSDKQTLIPGKLKSLAPINNAEYVDVYIAALEKGVEDQSVFNIALSGPYGSGKSSILKTFAKQTKHKCIEISLATFKAPMAKDDENATNNNISEDKMRLIEISILQQIVYATDPQKIPRSGFKRITDPPEYKPLLLSLYALIGLVSLTFFLRPKFIAFPPSVSTFLRDSQHIIFPFAVGGVVFALLLLLLWFFKMFLLSRISAKINVSVAELGLEKDNNVSILNKHIDEIIYIFESAEYNAVIIEDLDRFNDPEIFTKLREINNLINVALKSKKSLRKVTFIYAIKDDMFVNTKRTKFFELILPVMPVVDSSNAYDMALKEHKSAKVSDELLNYVTILINEKRFLDNIFNEYYVYRDAHADVLKDMEDKIFAMIVYKNMNPVDFAKLHENEGQLYDIFKKTKAEVQKKLIESYESDIKLLEKERQRIESVKHETIDSLVTRYCGAIARLSNGSIFLKVDDLKIALPNITVDHLLKIEQNASDIISLYSDTNSYYSSVEITLSQLKQKLNDDTPLSEQLEIIREGATERIRKNEIDIASKRNKIQVLQTLNLSDYLKDEKYEDVINPLLPNSPLLLFFIRRGYIDEKYTLITSRFYPESLSKIERDFIQGVYYQKASPFDLPLEHFPKILQALKGEDFSKDTLLNFSLMDFLLENEENHSDIIKKLFKCFSRRSKASDDFLFHYLDTSNHASRFIRHICDNWKGFWSFIGQYQQLSDEKKQEILCLLITHTSVEQISIQNEGASLTQYISSIPDFFSKYSDFTDFDKVTSVIKHLDVRFKDIEEYYKSRPWFDFICENNLYELNRKMVNLVMCTKSTKQFTDIQLTQEHYTCVLNSDYEPLIKYVNQNIGTYVTAILLTGGSKKEEGLEAFKILLQSNLSKEDKTKIIQIQNTLVDSIQDISDDFWANLFEYGNVAPNWSNVFRYYKHAGIDSSLTNYLNRDNVHEMLSNTYTVDGDGSLTVNFFYSLLQNNDITDSCFKYLVHSYESVGFEINQIDKLQNLSPKRIEILLDCHKIGLTTDTYKHLRDNYPDSHIELIANSINLYIDNPYSFPLESNDFFMLLKSDIITIEGKMRIIGLISKEMIASSVALVQQIYMTIYPANVSDLPFDKLVTVMNVLPDIAQRVQLLNVIMPKISEKEVSEALKVISNETANIVSQTGRTAHLENTAVYRQLANLLVEKGIVSSVKSKDNNITLYLKQKK